MSAYEERANWRDDDPLGAYKEAQDLYENTTTRRHTRVYRGFEYWQAPEEYGCIAVKFVDGKQIGEPIRAGSFAEIRARIDEVEGPLPVPEATECPECSGDGEELGSLGCLMHYRCRNCGWQYSISQWPSTRTT